MLLKSAPFLLSALILCKLSRFEAKCTNFIIGSVCISESTSGSSEERVQKLANRGEEKQTNREPNEALKNILSEVVFRPVLKAIFNATKRSRKAKNLKSSPRQERPNHDDLNHLNGQFYDSERHRSRRILEPSFQSSPNSRPAEEANFCNSGRKQSPIDILTRQAKVNNSMYVKLTAFHEPLKGVSVLNTGKTVKLSMPSNEVTPQISGPAVYGKTFLLHGVHFHWSSDEDSSGSEHSIDGKRFPMEVIY